MKDNFGVPMTRTLIANNYWELTDQKEFERRVKEYFALGYPGWSIEKVDREAMIVWIKDNRR